MAEQSNKSHVSRMSKFQSVKQKRSLRRLTWWSLGILLVVGLLFAARLVLSYDGVSQTKRAQLATDAAHAALKFGLTASSLKDDEQAVMPISPETWHQEIKQSIVDSLDDNVELATKVTYNERTYQRDDVLSQLADQYVKTLATDRQYQVEKITYDRYHNATVTYEVTPINLPKAQRMVQEYVDKQIKEDTAIAQFDTGELTLLEYALVASHWQRVTADKLPTNEPITKQFVLTYSSQNFQPQYTLSKNQLNLILNSGLAD
jgi:hypothetical protein